MAVVTINDIAIAATSISDSGAWNSPSKRTEEGFEYDSYVRSEPIEVSVEGWVPVEDYRELKRLRDQGEPFAASIARQVSLSKAKLNALDVSNEQNQSSHYKVSITIKEMKEATVETAEISIETEDGSSLGTAAEDTERSLAQPEDTDGGETEEATGGIAGTLAGVRESLSDVL
jgi:hypothetical protein